MSVHFSSVLNIRDCRVAKWSEAPGKTPLLAVVVQDGSVAIFNARGQAMERTASDRVVNAGGGGAAAALAWHPRELLLAVGWADGNIAFFGFTDAGRFHYRVAARQGHAACVTVLRWTPRGDAVVVGDAAGALSLLSVQRHSAVAMDWDAVRVEAACLKYDGRVTHLLFNTATPSPNAAINQAQAEKEALMHTVAGGQDVLDFFVAVAPKAGQVAVHQANAHGGHSELFVLDAGQELLELFYNAAADQLVCITRQNVMTVHAPDEAGWRVVSKMRFSTGAAAAGQPSTLTTAWAGAFTLCAASDDALLRMFNFETQGNYTLNPLQDAVAADGEAQRVEADASPDMVLAVAYHAADNQLAVGTLKGRLICYKHVDENSDEEVEVLGDMAARNWEMRPPLQCAGAIRGLAFGPTAGVLAAISADTVTVFSEATLAHAFCAPLVALQTSSQQVAIQSTDGQGHIKRAQTAMQVAGVALSASHLAMWDAASMDVFSIEALEPALVGTVANVSPPQGIALHGDVVYRCADARLEGLAPNGVVKEQIEFAAAEGRPGFVAVNGSAMAVLTSNLHAHVYSMKGRRPKECRVAKVHASVQARPTGEGGDRFGPPAAMRVSCDGQLVAVLFGCAGGAPGELDARLVVHDMETDSTLTLDLREHGCAPVSAHWAADEARLLALQVRVAPGSALFERVGISAVATVLAGDHALHLHDVQPLEPGAVAVALHTPFVLTSSKSRTQLVSQKCLTCFAGMESSEARTRSALLQFTLHMAAGNMDAAHKAVKAIKDNVVWASMAAVCVKTGKLDVLELCLANMENVRGARALREQQAKEGADDEAKLGMVAIHLGLQDEAVKLFHAAQRFDLVNALYQAMGRWDEALALAAKHDRIHLRSTHYRYAKHLEIMGELDGAIVHFELSGTHAYEVPRLLLALGDRARLEKYIEGKKASSPKLLKWWGMFCASQGEYAKAMRCFEETNDVLSQVRLLCDQGDYSAARERVQERGDRAAAFFLARRLEVLDRVPEAIALYGMAKQFAHGASLAKRQDLDQDLLLLAQRSDKATMLKTAEYFAARGDRERAAVLFQACGAQDRAISVAMAHQDGDDSDAALAKIAANLDASSAVDPRLLLDLAQRFKESEQWENAVRVLIGAGRHSEAVDLCLRYEVPLSEELAERMSPDKGAIDEPQRLELLRRVAKAARKQGNFHLAAKKYTQAGDRLKAMKVLMQSHDTDKIVLFANVSRNRDIYLMAAQYLQSSRGWLQDEATMKTIASFYLKAKSPEHLAGFYEQCAQCEIDECRDYGRALTAMQEALKQYNAAAGSHACIGVHEKIASLNRRMQMVHAFTQAQAVNSTDPQESLRLCQQLISQVPVEVSETEACTRIGDVYAAMIETYARQGDWPKALRAAQDMERQIDLTPYLDAQLLNDVYHKNGLQYQPPGPAHGSFEEPSHEHAGPDDEDYYSYAAM